VKRAVFGWGHRNYKLKRRWLGYGSETGKKKSKVALLRGGGKIFEEQEERVRSAPILDYADEVRGGSTAIHGRGDQKRSVREKRESHSANNRDIYGWIGTSNRGNRTGSCFSRYCEENRGATV